MEKTRSRKQERRNKREKIRWRKKERGN